MGNTRKKARSRTLALVLAVCMVVSMAPMVSAAEAMNFTDVSSSAWYYEPVKYVTANKYFEGTGNNQFSPSNPMTRGMFVTVLSRLDKVTVSDDVSPFSDVASGAWYAGEVAWASENKLASGTGNGMFSPDKSVTRQEMAAFMSRYISYYTTKNNVTFKTVADVKTFTDADKISSYAADAVSLCCSYGLIDGYTDGSFGPNDTATRAQVAAVIYRLALLLDTGETVVKEPAAQGGSSGGGGGGGSTESSSNETAKTAADFEKAAEKTATNVTATIEQENDLTVNDDVTIDNNGVKKLTLNLGSANLGDLTINSESAQTIVIDTDKDADGKVLASVQALTINAPNADVTNNVTVNGSVNIQAVSQNSFNNTATTGNITVSGSGAINDTQATPAKIVVDTTDPKAVVVVKGNSTAISVVANIESLTLAPAAENVAPKVESTAPEVKLSVETNNPVTIEGTVAEVTAKADAPALTIDGTVTAIKVETKAENPTLTVKGTGSISTLETGSAAVTIGGNEETETGGEEAKNTLAVATVKAAEGAKITAPANTISAVEAEGKVELDAEVETVTAAEGASLTLSEKAVVKTLEAAGSLTLAGSGSISSIDVQKESATITVAEDTDTTEGTTTSISVGQVTTTSTDTTKIEVKGITVQVQTKAAKPTGVTAIEPTEANGTGGIKGVDTTMEYRPLTDSAATAMWRSISTSDSMVSADDSKYKITSLAAGTYQVRVAAYTNDKVNSLASEPVTVNIPKAVGVNNAEIQGTFYVGKTLTAVANADATGTLSYVWYTVTTSGNDETVTAIENQTGKTLLLTDEYVGKKIKVKISNYAGDNDSSGTGNETNPYQNTATSSATSSNITVDKTSLKKLIDKAAEIRIGVTELTDDTKTAADIAEGIIFVNNGVATALTNAVNAGNAANTDSAKTDAVTAAVTGLRDAVNNYTNGKQTGTLNEIEKLRTALSDLITSAPAENDVAVNTAAENVTPGTKWILQADKDTYASAKTAATSAKNNQSATAATLSAAITTFNKAITAYNKAIQKGAPLDSSALLAAINTAEVNAASVKVSENGSDVVPSETWVNSAAKEVYTKAISDAKKVISDTNANTVQNDYTKALEKQETANVTFNAAKKAGTKDITAPVVTGVVVSLNNTTATVGFTTNEAGYYTYKVGAGNESARASISTKGSVKFNVEYSVDARNAKTPIVVKVADETGNITEVSVIPTTDRYALTINLSAKVKVGNATYSVEQPVTDDYALTDNKRSLTDNMLEKDGTIKSIINKAITLGKKSGYITSNNQVSSIENQMTFYNDLASWASTNLNVSNRTNVFESINPERYYNQNGSSLTIEDTDRYYELLKTAVNDLFYSIPKDAALKEGSTYKNSADALAAKAKERFTENGVKVTVKKGNADAAEMTADNVYSYVYNLVTALQGGKELISDTYDAMGWTDKQQDYVLKITIGADSKLADTMKSQFGFEIQDDTFIELDYDYSAE